MTALLLLAATASAGLSAPWWLLLIPGLLVVGHRRRQAGPTEQGPGRGSSVGRAGLDGFPTGREHGFESHPRPGSLTEQHVATIYVRKGKLVLRRRRGAS